MKNLELYLHIPFCIQKCLYCDFLSMPADYPVREAYIKQLITEIRQKSAAFSGYVISTVFLGGGTPSILDGAQIQRLMQAVLDSFAIADRAEITMECNPGTLTIGKLTACRRAGINRLSLGLQSVREEELKRLGRIHSYQDFLHSYDLVRRAGFDNVNLDLMSGLPFQKLADWEHTLREVCKLKPEHISAYGLIIEEGTPFYQYYQKEEQKREAGEQPSCLPEEETERAMYQLTKQMLWAHGYHQYEISNYARPGKECRHNIGYWTRENYLGLGLGSASLIENTRFSNPGALDEYLNGAWEPQEVETLERTAQMEEFMFLGLRMMRGISRSRFRELFQIELEGAYGPVIKKLTQQGLLRQLEGNIALTPLGVSLSNYVMSEFLIS